MQSYSNGKPEGQWSEWFESGVSKKEYNWVDGKLDGIASRVPVLDGSVVDLFVELKDYEQAHLTWNKGRYGKYKILKKLNKKAFNSSVSSRK